MVFYDGEKSEGNAVKESSTVKKNYEFRRLYQKGKSAVGRSMVVYARPNRWGHNRIGVTVSAKLGKATVRNRVRRRFREIFRLNDAQVKQGYDFILVARSRAVAGSYAELNRSYRKLIRELELWEGTE